MVNLPTPGTDQADALVHKGITLLKPSEPALEMLDQNHRYTDEMPEQQRLFLYSVAAVPLNMMLTWVVLGILGAVLGPLFSRSSSTKVAYRAGS